MLFPNHTGENDDSASDAGSVSDSGFSPISSSAKGKGKFSSGGGVDYTVLSIQQLLDIQKTEIEHVTGIIGIKVSPSSLSPFAPHLSMSSLISCILPLPLPVASRTK